jgi:hypothetical protein
MTDDEFDDFAEQMRVLVAEGSYLWEFPPGSRDLLGNGEWREHGPWRQEDCAAAVKLWLDEGLLSLVGLPPEEDQLSETAARNVLASPQAWMTSTDGSTNIAVVPTEAGEALAWADWLARLSVLCAA